MSERHKPADVFIGRANGKDIEIKIWVDDTPYNRADIFDELVEALTELMYARTDKAESMTEAALKKLEEE